MPLFDFRCRACGHEFEALVRAGYPPACPSCGKPDLEQKPSTFAVSSSERRGAAASKSVQKAAEIGRRDNSIRAAEAEEHKKHEH